MLASRYVGTTGREYMQVSGNEPLRDPLLAKKEANKAQRRAEKAERSAETKARRIERKGGTKDEKRAARGGMKTKVAGSISLLNATLSNRNSLPLLSRQARG